MIEDPTQEAYGLAFFVSTIFSLPSVYITHPFKMIPRHKG